MRLWVRRGAIPYKSRTDVDLMCLARHGNTEAFDELVLRYRDRIYAMARDLLVRDEHVVDAVREAFVSAYREMMAADPRGAGGKDPGANPGRWFHRHAVRAVLSRVVQERTTADAAARS